MSRVAVVGLGAMGRQLARRLLDAGHDVVVWNRSPRDFPAPFAASPREAAARADVVITMVADPRALAAVTEGDDGVLAGLEGRLVQMSTVSPEATARLAALTGRLVDAPVLGSIGEAESGTLTIFAGGDITEVQPVLATLGRVLPVGAVGAGTAAKLVANATLFGVLAALGETVALGRVLGLDDATLFDVLAATPLAAQAERRRAVLAGEPSPPRFPARLALKDAELIAAVLDQPALAGAKHWLAAVADGDADYTAMLSEPSRAAAARRSSS
ncbi:MAG TPA: NAD(P)-dependent oxidoreductase [Gaiellaceae bacterium]|jgi:3-hydroxyisobutyrate dehydrogenase-like beta-hydroxyacid dehydrogenase